MGPITGERGRLYITASSLYGTVIPGSFVGLGMVVKFPWVGLTNEGKYQEVIKLNAQ